MAVDETSAYERWMQAQAIPIYSGYDVPDVRQLRREAWAATGGKGCIVDLKGMEGFTNAIVGEIAAGASLQPQKHLFQEMTYILDGSGYTEVWAPGSAERTRCQWQTGTLYAIPLNCWSQMVNTGVEPALYISVTDAPLVLDVFHDDGFIFDNEQPFPRRFDGSADYFSRLNERQSSPRGVLWLANAIQD